MTPLPKHLEEMRDEFAEKFAGSQIAYGYMAVKDAAQEGFNQAASIMLKEMESMAKNLEVIVDSPENASDAYGAFKISIRAAREALTIWREKYVQTIPKD